MAVFPLLLAQLLAQPLPPTSGRLPAVEGLDRYPAATLNQVLAPCAAEVDPQQRLNDCAARLTARLVADGYVNSRVIALVDPPPRGRLVVVEGRLVEVRVQSRDPGLQRRLQRLVLPLQGQVVHLPSLERQLDQVERQPGVGAVATRLNRLGGDNTKVALLIEADPAPRPLVAELTLSNDGSDGTGQFRSVALLAKEGWLLAGDELLVLGELNSDREAELGYRQASLSYSLPLGDRLMATTGVAASRRAPVDDPIPQHDVSDSQQQLTGELDLTLWDSLDGRLSVFAGLSANRNQASRHGRRSLRWSADAPGSISSGYGRAGLALEAWPDGVDLVASVYGLQAIPGLSPNRARRELAASGIRLTDARALAGDLRLGWSLAPGWDLELRAAAQLAFNPLTEPMGFSLGSDNGLLGLPGQVDSGDSGVLGSGELRWRIWRQGRRQLQLVPFLGAGWIRTELPGRIRRSHVGAGGLLVRWLQGRHWVLELGWASQFGRTPAGAVPNWLIDNGLYTRVSYRL
ncbi:MAG: ShlB/FhaC/HecB family hemolysin secretion/activation protein [Cyanobacteriota bacterium]|nr:ShlB/FhaC/HecB family hemolysin secretion/activation protein [Cyanobacteriota bacterium]